MNSPPVPVVLVVDDNEAGRYVTCHHLRAAGYRVIETATGAGALALAAQIPDGIVLDVKLPDLSGFEVCRRLRAEPRTAAIPVLHLSGAFPDEASRIAGLESGADGYLTQPVEPAVLLAHVQALLRTGRLLREIREREERFRTLFEASADGLALLDPAQYSIVTVNGAFAALLGYSREALTGRSILEYFPEDKHPRVRALVLEAEEKGTLVVCDVLLPHKDGTLRSTNVSFSVMTMGAHTYVLASVRDETERQAMGHRLAQSSRMASVGMLAAGVAHELNNPLAWVLYNLQATIEDLEQHAGALEPALRSRLDPLRGHLRAAEEGAQRMRSVVADLQAFSRVEPDRRVPCDLATVLQAAASMAHNEIRFRARLELALCGPLPVLGNEGRLSQVFLNLLVNAARAIDEGHPERNHIEVRGVRERGAVRVTISDTGPGVPPEHLAHIFDPFFATRSPQGGIGMGLAISHAIVGVHGGHIDVASTPGQGSTFTVVLPEHLTAHPATAPAHTPQGRSLRLLVIDDEPHLVRALTRLLERAGHTVISAGSGREAETILEVDRAFDAVICDLMLPDVLGIDLHAAMVARDPEFARRFLFLTGGTFTPRAQEYLAATTNPVLGKPAPRARLLEAIEALAAAPGPTADG
ncbi:MAG: response regulator [Pseudomonadota bacterium]